MIDIKEIKTNNILVIGDVMIDTYYMGQVKRISPEAPVPVMKKENEKCVLGGAANVASNLVSANQEVYMMTVIGNGQRANKFYQLLSGANIKPFFIHRSDKRITTEKIRLLGQNNQQIMRVDIEDIQPISETETEKLLENLEDHIEEFELIVMSDYLKGVLSFEFTQGVIQIAKKHNKKVLIDVKDPNIEKYRGAYLLKPNLSEVRQLTGLPAKTEQEIYEASLTLCEDCDCNYVLTTCGEKGMMLVDREGRSKKIECYAREVFDVTGAGDTVIAYLSACIASNINIEDAVEIANVAAGIKVSKVGTSSISLQDVKVYYNEVNHEVGLNKIIHSSEIDELRKTLGEKKIVFTNGCFDILHSGHVKYLKEASELGDILILGVNTDDSVRRLKGSERPINSLEDRVEVLAALEFIDYIIAFNEDTPIKLIERVRPDVLVKGADYKKEDVVGREYVESIGGRVELITYINGKSTTNILNKLKNNEREIENNEKFDNQQSSR